MNYRTLGDCLKEKQNNFNIIRLVAALSVIYGHADAVTGRGPADIFLQYVGFKFIGGVAVDVFFVVSGFLVAASALSGNGILYYLKSRLLRIYPALFVCVGLTVLLLGPALTVSADYWRAPETWRFLWVNASAYGTEYFLPGVFQGMHDKAVNGSLWSLAVEVKMYWIVLALYVLGILKSRSLFNGLFFCSLVVGYFAPDAGLPQLRIPH
jgi:peptidoglycan/LPS O-acetylase OafA/YrhL